VWCAFSLAAYLNVCADPGRILRVGVIGNTGLETATEHRK
jgi:hypothetical protein